MPKPRGYVGLLVLIITVAIIVYLMTMQNSPLQMWYGGTQSNPAPLKQQVNTLQQNVNKQNSEMNKQLQENLK